MASSPMLCDLIATLQHSVSILHKQDIQMAANAIGQFVQGVDGESIRLGDDCAAVPNGTGRGDGYLLLASEGIWPQLVAQDPWFAGWCAIMVNLSDIAAMGGTAMAVVDALWSQSEAASEPIWEGMQAAARAYGVPIVGGHTNCHSPYEGLSVAVMGRSQHLLTSFDAQPGDSLMMAIAIAGGTYRGNYPFWDAATTADHTQLRRHLALLPQLANAGLCQAGKDISMGGLAGTLLMLCEASGCGAILELDRVPHPEKHGPSGSCWQDIGWCKWLTSFPSFGFLLSVSPQNVESVAQHFIPHGLTCQTIGTVISGSQVFIQQNHEKQLFWDLTQPLTGFKAQR